MSGDTAWILVSAALVMFMVHGLALFYGGMVGARNVLNMLNMNLYCLGGIPLLWAVCGFGFASGDWSFPLFGDFDAAFLNGVDGEVAVREFAFGMTFAVITPALISGAVAGRMKFTAWAVFVPLWSFLVYSRRDDRPRPGTARRNRLQRMMIDTAGPGSIVQQRRVLTL